MEEFIGTFKISRYQGKEEGGPLLFKKEEKHRVEKEPFFGLDDKTWVVLPLLTLAYLCTYYTALPHIV